MSGLASMEVNDWKIEGRVFHRRYKHVCRNLTPAEQEDLRLSIAEDGIRNPVVLDEHDNIIDGDNRLRIAWERDIPLTAIPFQVLKDLTDDAKERIAADLNKARRHLTPEEVRAMNASRVKIARKAHVEETGFEPSLRSTGKVAGVDGKTVKKSTTAEGSAVVEPPKTLGLDNKLRPAQRPAPEQVRARRLRILELADAGTPWKEIAEREGVSTSTVGLDLGKIRAEIEREAAREKAVEMRREGALWEEVAEATGLSKSQLHADFTKAGLVSPRQPDEQGAPEPPEPEPEPPAPTPEPEPKAKLFNTKNGETVRQLFTEGKRATEIVALTGLKMETVHKHLAPLTQAPLRDGSYSGPVPDEIEDAHPLTEIINSLEQALESHSWSDVRFQIEQLKAYRMKEAVCS